MNTPDIKAVNEDLDCEISLIENYLEAIRLALARVEAYGPLLPPAPTVEDRRSP